MKDVTKIISFICIVTSFICLRYSFLLTFLYSLITTITTGGTFWSFLYLWFLSFIILIVIGLIVVGISVYVLDRLK